MVSGQNERTNEQNQMFVRCGLKEMESCVWYKAKERELPKDISESDWSVLSAMQQNAKWPTKMAEQSMKAVSQPLESGNG